MHRWMSRGIVPGVLAALLFMGGAGCADDTTDGNDTMDTGNGGEVDAGDTDDGSIDDGGGDEDADDGGGDTGSDGGGDAGEDGGGEDAGDTGAGEDGGHDAGSDADDTGPDGGDAGTDGGGGEEDCTYPPPEESDCPDGDHGPGSFFNEFTVEESGDCCKDFNGDGDPDSAVGDLASDIEGIMGVDFNDEIDQQIQAGELVYLLEYADWRDAMNDSGLDMWLYFGEDTDNDFQPNLNGDGDFYITPESLDDNGDPRSSFPQASVSNGEYSVTGGSAPLMLPAGTDLVEIEADEIDIDADVDSGADLEAGGRVELTNGELSAEVALDDIFEGLNDAGQQCSCISNDTHPVYTEESSGWTCNSTSSDANACDGAGEMCEYLSDPTMCDIGGSTLEDSADLDTDGDGEDDALSLGVEFEAVGAKIEGEAP